MTTSGKLWPTPLASSAGTSPDTLQRTVDGEFQNTLDRAVLSEGLSQTDTSGEDQLTLLLPDFPVRTYQRQARAPGSTALGLDYGSRWHESLSWFDPSTSFWRTWQRSLLEDWSVFSETWPRSGMVQSGIAYRLPSLVRLTGGTGGGALPTPSVMFADATATPTTVTRSSPPLGALVQMHPTPTASDAATGATDLIRHASLAASINRSERYWPTPCASDNRDRGNRSSGAIRRRIEKGKQIMLSQSVSDQSGQLNPTWVEWLMGYPTGWTDLKD